MKQQHKMLQFFGCVRFIYNWGLDRKIKAYKETKKNVNYIQLARELTQLKQTDDHNWLCNCANEALQQSLRCLDNAYTNFFRDKKGFPKFKSKKHSKDSCKFINAVHFDFIKNKVKIPKIGWVKLCPNETFDELNVKMGTLTVSRDKCGDYWCSIVIDDGKPSKPKAKVCEETAVGIDLGIKHYAVLSDGTKFSSPKYLKREQVQMKRLQRKFARAQKGSKRREALRNKIARQYRKITNRRVDFLHKLSTNIVRKFDTICVEDLNIEGMLKNHHLANSIQSAAWGEFVRQLTYKCDWGGKNLVFIGRFEPSSQICHICGYQNREVKNLNVREWVCPECGEKHDRDINAAKNICNFGLQMQTLIATENKIP